MAVDPKQPKRRVRRRGFALIELLVVVTIIVTLVLLMLPAVQTGRAAARRTTCRNNLKQIGISLAGYYNTYETYPPGWTGADPETGAPSVEGGAGWGWGSQLLAHLDQTPVMAGIDFGQPIGLSTAGSLVAIETYRCPSANEKEYWDMDDRTGSVIGSVPTSNYVGNFGGGSIDACYGLEPGVPCTGDEEGPLSGIFFLNSSVRHENVLDGLSNTIFVGERHAQPFNTPSTWAGVVSGADKSIARILGSGKMAPSRTNRNPESYGSQHQAGVHILFGDGQVRMLNRKVDDTLFRALSTRSGREMTSSF